MTGSSEPSQTAGWLDFPRADLSPQGLLAELGTAAFQLGQASDLCRLGARVVARAMGVEQSVIIVTEGEDLRLEASWGWGEELDRPGLVDGAISMVRYASAVPDPVILTDLARETRFESWPFLAENAASGIIAAIPGSKDPQGVVGVFSRRHRSFTSDEADYVLSVAQILGARLLTERHRATLERRVRYQAALVECAQALLVGSGDNRVRRAAEALLGATDVESVFIERNVEHPELGLCTSTVAEVDRPGTPAAAVGDEYDYWDLVPWDRLPISRSYLERGEHFVVYPEKLWGEELEVYAADPFPTKSELDIPIQVRGEWAGVVAFSESSVRRDWAEEDVSLLTAAAQMIGAFWEAESAREMVQDLVDSKDQLIASVSHELRTPLTSVVGFAKLLQMEGSALSQEERLSVIKTIAEEGVDLANTVDDLLVAAKLEAGTLAFVSVPIDLRAQSAQVVEACRPGDAVRIVVSSDSVKAKGDPARVRQILRNLLSNAIKYGGDLITVDVVPESDMACIRVRDNGPGISADDRDRVFESYYRGESDPGLAGSMGLGLAISRRLAELMGGSLGYRYENGESVFELELPRFE